MTICTTVKTAFKFFCSLKYCIIWLMSFCGETFQRQMSHLCSSNTQPGPDTLTDCELTQCP
jgi:hypothetical protein